MNLLLVDDHSLYREALEMLMTPLDEIDDVYHAESGAEAIDAIKNHPAIDMVLLDYNLDDGLGIDIMLRIRAIRSEIPICIVSADDQPKIIQKCIDAGANGYVLKKMKSAEIGFAIKEILAGHIFVPEGILDSVPKSNEATDSDNLAEVARTILQDKDLSIRADGIENTSKDVVSAFNTLLDHLQDNQKQLQEMAFSDELTGLYNRRYFLDQLDKYAIQQQRSKISFAIVFIDLDYFKEVNDTYGHKAGDELLVEIAKRLRSSARESDLVARIGGDEFTMILGNGPSKETAQACLERILENLNEPFELDGDITLYPSASIGAAISCTDISMPTLMNSADEALYEVKKNGRNGVKVFNR